MKRIFYRICKLFLKEGQDGEPRWLGYDECKNLKVAGAVWSRGLLIIWIGCFPDPDNNQTAKNYMTIELKELIDGDAFQIEKYSN